MTSSEAEYRILQEIRGRSERWAAQTRYGGTPIRDLAPSNAGQAAWDRAWLLDYVEHLKQQLRDAYGGHR